MSIFGEKRISLKHWRYRLLHWCFNVRDIELPEDSPLPDYLYSHYCPFFHLTNFIALFSLPILTIKSLVWACKGIFLACMTRPFTPIELQWRKFDELASSILIYGNMPIVMTFENFWDFHNFNLLDRDEAEVRFEQIRERSRVEHIRREYRNRLIGKSIYVSRFLGRVFFLIPGSCLQIPAKEFCHICLVSSLIHIFPPSD